MYPSFQTKQRTLTFLAQIYQKRNLKLEIHRTNVGIQLAYKFSQKGNQDLKFRKLMLQQESASLRYHVYQFSDKTDIFVFLGQNLPKNGFWCQNFKDLRLDLKSVSLRYYAYQFSDKTDNFEYLGPSLPKTRVWDRNSKI